MCDVFPSSSKGLEDEDQPSVEVTYSFSVEQITERSVDEIDGINVSHHDSNEDTTIEQDKYKTNQQKEKKSKPCQRVSFDEKLVSAVHRLERITPDEKARMFYTSKDLSGFRIDYIIELQEMHEQQYRSGRKPYGSTILRTLTSKLGDIVVCRPFIDLFCGDYRKASV